MQVNEDLERLTMRRRLRVLEQALDEAINGLARVTAMTMSEKHDLILKLSAIKHMKT